MLDVLSAALAAFGILQNIRETDNREDRIKSLSEALGKIDGLYSMLGNAKEAHDRLQATQQRFGSRIDDMCDEKPNNEIANSIKSDNCKKIVGDYNRSSLNTIIMALSPPAENNEAIPILGINENALDKAKKIVIEYSEFYLGLTGYRDDLIADDDSITWYIDNSDFGLNFRRRLQSLNNNLGRSFMAADRLIVNSIPVLSALHHETKRASNELR